MLGSLVKVRFSGKWYDGVVDKIRGEEVEVHWKWCRVVLL